MNSIFYSVITLLLLTCGVLLLMRSANKNRNAENGYAENQPEILSKEEGEFDYSGLVLACQSRIYRFYPLDDQTDDNGGAE